MVIFKQTRGPKGGIISGGKGSVIPSLSQNWEAGGAKVLLPLIKSGRRLKPSERLCALLPGVYKLRIRLKLVSLNL